NLFCQKEAPKLSQRESRSALVRELEILISNLDRGTKDYKKASWLKDKLKECENANEVIYQIKKEDSMLKLCVDAILLKLKSMGLIINNNNEAMRCEYISIILNTVVSFLESLKVSPQMNISGVESNGRVDFAVKTTDILDELICIVEGKQNLPGIGIAQNLIQCKSACDMNLITLNKKRKAKELDIYDYYYIYGIISLATEWIFLFHSTEGIYATTNIKYHIPLMEDALQDLTELHESVKEILEIIVGLLDNRLSASKNPLPKNEKYRRKLKHNIVTGYVSFPHQRSKDLSI
ncbi:19056_t:CDS:2, partial [Racocetra persica]